MSQHFVTDVLGKHSYSCVGNALSGVYLTPTGVGPAPNNWANKRCSVSRIAPRHFLPCDNTKELNECTVSNVSSAKLETDLLRSEKHRKSFDSFDNTLSDR